jgi:hypothetical protein
LHILFTGKVFSIFITLNLVIKKTCILWRNQLVACMHKRHSHYFLADEWAHARFSFFPPLTYNKAETVRKMCASHSHSVQINNQSPLQPFTQHSAAAPDWNSVCRNNYTNRHAALNAALFFPAHSLCDMAGETAGNMHRIQYMLMCITTNWPSACVTGAMHQ